MDFFLNELAEKSIEYAISQGADYCDARAEKQTRKSALIENSEIEHVREASDDGIGIRLLKNDAWGFFAISNPDDFEKIKISIDRTIKNVAHYSEKKKTHTKLVPIKIKKVTKNFPVLEKPDLDSMIKVGLECDKIILGQPKVRKSTVTPWYSENLKYFVSSEGCEITQIFTDVVIEMAAIAHESGLTQSINVTEGGRGGMEQITRNNLAQTSASNISTKASELLDSIPAKEEKTTLVMNPDFVSLLTHEILGHPSEADRVLGKEMAWAGGAWWKDKIGEKIGSEELNVFDDPTIPESLGWYYFDDEGVEARKTTLVENGILKNHLQSRETASHFDVHPTANMRSTSYRFMPLIRMACTCIQEGNWSPDDMIRDVKNGYLISNMKIPSIDMKRYNWSISCQYAQKIECGEITDLVRDVIVMGTAPEFFQSIDACGNDFTVRPITNCGKGDPMQSMIMGNGGPSIRGIATIKSVN